MAFRFGDIYLANFDPSTRIETFYLPDIFIEKDVKNRLARDSVIRVCQISSFDTRRFIHFIGSAKSPVLRKVRGYLRKHFGL